MSTASILGRAWRFPIAPDAGSLASVSGAGAVSQSIRIILETEPGERIMRPTFGCGLRRYLMKPNTLATRSLMKLDVERALRAWEPRIELSSVRVDPGDDPAQVLVRIDYVHTRDRRPGNLVFPFYLE